MIGTVKWFNVQRGFGFITRADGGGDVFVHFNAIIEGVPGQKKLDAGERVEFDVHPADKGPAAVNVRRLAAPPGGGHATRAGDDA